MEKHKATYLSGSIALQASGLPEIATGEVPEWIHILPAGEARTVDGRGPYISENPDQIIAASMQEGGGKIVVDENHSTDIAGKAGLPARAAGWVVELQSREDGIWAKVEWTKEGEALLSEKSYRGISPVIIHDKANKVARILRISLTNKPNLRDMVALHSQTETETIMDMSALIALLGLEEGATEEDVTAAIKKLTDAKTEESGEGDDAAMQSALSDIAAKLGKDVKAESVAICSAIDAVQTSGDSAAITEMKAMQSQMVEALTLTRKDRAEAVVDKAITEMRAGVKPLRAHYISRHMAGNDGAAAVEKELAGLPSLGAEGYGGNPALQSAGKDGLTAADREAIAVLGVDPKKYAETLAVDKYHIEFDRLGTYATRFQMMGANAAAFPDELVFSLLKAGFASDCYDGQFFFDTDHPVLDANGNKITVSNMAAGAETPWYLLSTTRSIKPLIYQTLKPWEMVSMDNPTDANVFNRKEYVYGTEGASNAGFGFWQAAFGSRLALDATNYEAARGAMMGFKNDGGKPLGITPDLLVVPPSLEGAARRIVGNELAGGGNTNEWYKTAEVLVVPWLA